MKPSAPVTNAVLFIHILMKGLISGTCFSPKTPVLQTSCSAECCMTQLLQLWSGSLAIHAALVPIYGDAGLPGLQNDLALALLRCHLQGRGSRHRSELPQETPELAERRITPMQEDNGT